jgi:hypothetical protein
MAPKVKIKFGYKNPNQRLAEEKQRQTMLANDQNRGVAKNKALLEKAKKAVKKDNTINFAKVNKAIAKKKAALKSGGAVAAARSKKDAAGRKK